MAGLLEKAGAAVRYPAAERITALEWLALFLMLLVFAAGAGTVVGSVIAIIRALRG
jgi:hypothetical protein